MNYLVADKEMVFIMRENDRERGRELSRQCAVLVMAASLVWALVRWF